MAVSERTSVSVEDLIADGAIVAHKDGNYGSKYPRVEEFGSEGVPFLTAKSLRNGHVDIAGAPKLSDARADELTFGFVEPDDVLLSHNATIGRVAVVPRHDGRLLVGTSLTYFRLNPRKLLPRYLAVYMAGTDFQHQLAAMMSHSTRNQVPVTAQRSLHVVVPAIAEQRVIANIFGTLDDKIELNRRTSEALEAMARALFKSWFVDFHPVHAKLEGRWQRGQSLPGLPAHLYDLFPDRLVDSELGEIPEGWEVGNLGDLAEQLREQVNPAASAESAFAHFSLPAFDAGQRPTIELGNDIKSNKWRVPPGSVLLSKLNPEIERVWLVDVDAINNAIGSTEFLVLVPRAPFARSYVYCLARSVPFRQQMESLVTGTSKSHQRAQSSAVMASPVVMPSPPVVEAFDNAVADWLGKVLVSTRESRTLATLRDALLPKLISGDLRIKDAASYFGEVAA